MRLKELKRRGQVMVLWAVLSPLLICFVGVGIDLGWYYLTVSRLQNAADAAALAGAMKLVEQNNDLSDYYVYSLTTKPSSDFKTDGAYTLYYVNEDGHYTSKPIIETPGKDDAKKYANKNLAENSNTNKVTDAWNTIKKNEGVTFSSGLYARKMDIDREENGIKYYMVTLTEQVSHLFLRGFEPMQAKVVAYALLKPHSVDLVTIINQLEKSKVIGNWMYQDKHKDSYTGNWNHYRQTIPGSESQKNIAYKDGDAFRTETVNVQTDEGSYTNNVNTSSGQKTDANGRKYYSESQVDSLNIDFNQDVRFGGEFTTKDWDLRTTDLTGIPTITYRGMAGWSATHGYDLRIQGLINFNSAWTNRNLLDSDTSNDADNPDILWTRIEGDPIWSDSRSAGEKSLNSVHEMIVNVHTSNAATKLITDANGDKHTVYQYRPFFIFYMGPESNVDILKTTANQTFAEIAADTRKSQPVILNFYEDWNAILYMPNSPVIINGNGHKLTGFIIAKEYLRAREAGYYTGNGYVTGTDAYGNTILFKRANVLTEAEFNTLSEDYSVSTDSAQGTYSLYEKVEAPQYLILSITKAAAQQYSNFSAYIAATYKTKFMAATGLSESQISTVTFPTGENHIEDAFTVATADLSDTQVSSTYVKVIVDGAEKYIDKGKLPYIKVRRNSSRPYVSVYDFHKTKASGDSGVNTIDDSLTLTGSDTSADLWRPTTDQYNNDMYINKALLTGTYDNWYVDSQITIVNVGNVKYFIRNSEITTDTQLVAEYRKLTYGNATYYLKENDATYYMQIVPGGATGKDANGNTVTNPIIIDNKGDLQTEPLPLSDSSYNATRPTKNPEEYPDDDKFKKKITNPVTGEVHDYRIKSLEVVYYKSAFNLSEDSCYSYFKIASLHREVYTYLNVDELAKTTEYRKGNWKVDDMFFTTKRASWID